MDTTPLLAHLGNTVRYEQDQVFLLNRRIYPEELSYLRCMNYEQVAEAIEDMTIQGAIVIAIAAGYGFALAMKQTSTPTQEFAEQVYDRLLRTRPTGQRLKTVLDQCLQSVKQGLQQNQSSQWLAEKLIQLMNEEVEKADDIAEQCGKWAAQLLADGDRVQTHCFADSALIHMVMEAKRQGKEIEMYCTETRPYFQGARLTAHSIQETGTKVTLVTDSMPGLLMQQGIITKLITAADKITLDGHVCNKIGTYPLAVVAHHHQIPFYVLGYEGPDRHSPHIDQIEIEYRDPEEIFYAKGVRTAVEGIEGLYPSFDIVPPTFVDAIVTERGIYSSHGIRFAIPEY